MHARFTAADASAALFLFSLFTSVVSHSAETLAAHDAAQAVLSATPILQLRDAGIIARRPTVSIYGGRREEGEHVHDHHHQEKGKEPSISSSSSSSSLEEGGSARVRALVEHNPYDVEVKKVFMVLSSHFDAGCKVKKGERKPSLTQATSELNHARLSTTQPRPSLNNSTTPASQLSYTCLPLEAVLFFAPLCSSLR
jgi:hypothetical protein